MTTHDIACRRARPRRSGSTLRRARLLTVLFWLLGVGIGFQPVEVSGAAAGNQVLEFSAWDQFLEVPETVAVEFESVTVEGWVHWTEFNSWSRFFDFGAPNASVAVTVLEATSELRFGIDPRRSAGQFEYLVNLPHIRVTNLLRPGEWCHIAAVSGPGGMRLYFNGTLVGEHPFEGGFRDVFEGTVTPGMNRFGRNANPLADRWFNGRMDELRIWKVRRTGEEIRGAMFQSLSGDEEGLVGLWNFDEGDGRDSTPNRNDAVIHGGARCVPENLPGPESLPVPFTLHGKVLDPRGDPISKVSIQVFDDRHKLLELDDGNSFLQNEFNVAIYPPKRPLTVRVETPLFGRKRFDLATPTTDRTGLSLRIGEPEAFSIEGSVFALDGATPLNRVGVRLLSAPTPVPTASPDPDPSRKRGPGQPGPPGSGIGTGGRPVEIEFTDSGGRFKFEGLAPGRYRVQCQTGDGWNPEGHLVDLSGQSEPVVFLVAPFKKGLWTVFGELQGFARNQIYCIERDPAGHLWLGTMFGLYRFDGVRFDAVELTEQGGSSHVNALHLDRRGMLWIGTGAGVSRWVNNTVEELTLDSVDPAPEITAIGELPDGSIWFGTAGRGLYRWRDGSVTHRTTRDGLGGNWITSIQPGADGELVVGAGVGTSFDLSISARITHLAGGGGVSRLRDGMVRRIGPEDGLVFPFVRSIESGDGNGMWFGTAGGGAFEFRPDSLEQWTEREGLIGDVVHAVHHDSDRAVWFGTDRGVSRFDGTHFVNYDQADGLLGTQVFAIERGPEGGLWFGTDAGLCRFNDARMRHFNAADGLRLGPVHFSARGGDGALWFGTSIAPEVARVKDGKIEMRSVGSDIGWAKTAPDGTVWFGHESGLSFFDATLDAFVDVPGAVDHADPNRDGFHGFDFDPDGSIWLGSYKGWISRYDPNTATFTHVERLPGKPGAMALHHHGDGRIWFSTNRGLIESAPAVDGGRATRRMSEVTGIDALNSVLLGIHETSEGALWIGTFHAGAAWFADGKFTVFNAANSPLPHQSVYQVVEDRNRKGLIWMGTGEGVARHDGTSWSTLQRTDGLPARTVYSVVQDTEGNVWFGTDSGVVRYRPRRAAEDPYILSVRTESDSGSELMTSTDRDGSIRLSTGVKSGAQLTLHYFVNDLESGRGGRRFRCRVENGSPPAATIAGTVDWSEPSSETRFQWIPDRPGHYTFAVQYIDLDLNYSKPALCRIEVLPLWYQNRPIAFSVALGAAGLLGSSLFFGYRYFQQRRLIRVREIETRKLIEAKNASLAEARNIAETANRAKSLFLANMSHEIRTPMNAILGYAQLMRRESDIPSRFDHGLATIERSGDHLLTLINDILDLSKIEAGRMMVQCVDFDLNGFLGEIEDMFRLRCEQKALVWRLQRPGSEPLMVHGDQGKLFQILVNLLGNAVKFTEQGSISLSVSMDLSPSPSTPTTGPEADPTAAEVQTGTPCRFVFEVSDTGPGIPRSELPKLFEPFRQGNLGLKEDGTGLGLVIVKRQTELMKGTVSVDSRVPGGTRFVASIPLIVKQPRAPVQSAAKRLGDGQPMRSCLAAHKIRALVVDDVAENRDVLEKMLVYLGCSVCVAANGSEALQRLPRFRPNIVFMDIRMPVMDGLTASDEIKKSVEWRHLKVVAVSASVLSHEQKRIEEPNFDGFIAKPFRIDQIAERVVSQLNLDDNGILGENTESAGPKVPIVPVNAEPIRLPDELYRSLVQAARMYRVNEARRLLKQLDEQCPQLTEFTVRLRDRIAVYKMDEMLELLNQTENARDPSGE